LPEFRLYVILDIDICKQQGNIVEIAEQVILGKADVIQLRAKNCSDRKVIKIAQDIIKLTKTSKTLFILNDRTDLAQIISADGIHLGQEDICIKDARNILDVNKIVGISTHSTEQAILAEQEGADYIAIGPIFPTTTKFQLSTLGPKIILQIKEKIKIPFVAVGGINLDNLGQILDYGARRIAVCKAIVSAKDIVATTKEFRSRLYENPSFLDS
jgi:thiamine-phosphate pyrophosphorylase